MREQATSAVRSAHVSPRKVIAAIRDVERFARPTSSAFQYQRALLREALPPDHPSLLMVDSEDIGELQLGLQSQFDVRVATTEAEAVRSLKLLTPAFLVTELDLSDGDGVKAM